MFSHTPRVGIPIELGSPADIAIIIVAALIIFGPKKPYELLTDLGQAMHELREITRNK